MVDGVDVPLKTLIEQGVFVGTAKANAVSMGTLAALWGLWKGGQRLCRWLVGWMGLLLLVAGPVRAQDPMGQEVRTQGDSMTPVGTVPDVIAYKQLNALAGVTFCVNGHIVSFVRLEGNVVNDDADTRAHEAMHQEQYRRMGCQAFDDYYRSAVGMRESEAEAYVAGWCVGRQKNYAIAERVQSQYLLNLYQKLQSVFGGYRNWPGVADAINMGAVSGAWRKYAAVLCKE